MSRMANRVAGMLRAAVSLSALADAQELAIFHTITIDAPAEKVWAVAGDGRSVVEWRGRFRRLAYWTDEPPQGQDDKSALNFLNGSCVSGLAGLKQILEAR